MIVSRKHGSLGVEEDLWQAAEKEKRVQFKK
jgi:hypothetical protein